ncbi:PREDICTED: BUD13 homolog [Nelumbo nucifera]|uniref:BUD13 homolog n=2 Tax=Nelumbo nucifera TaxID=4432 RepID=A0A1U8AQ13_NELNU|nr:PREDICTED: BUD13 homolog [Nelumbo nucifera]XP_010269908.1 PREDICTED: BUD13 homolog [Nelumbo nucifera]DAD47575.1 TPA_asm: hypothetical protein HUJ06_017512 [Nelumbo nucifera]
MAASASASASLKEYLKRYTNDNEDEKKKKKKKKKVKAKTNAVGVLVVDEDPVWQKPVQLDDEKSEDDSADEEKPQIDEDIEVKRLKRLEQIRSQRPYHAISEDGSGWVSISDAPKQAKPTQQDSDISPPRQRRARCDTPSPSPELNGTSSGHEAPDLSPPRQRRVRYDTPSPEPKLKHTGSGSEAPDLSPPRRRRARYDTPSPEPERKRTRSGNEAPDLSPPRQRRARYDIPSPGPERKHTRSGNEAPDLSPLKQQRRARYDTPSPEPERKRTYHGNEASDLSPPRRRQQRYQTPSPENEPKASNSVNPDHDLSPPRRSRSQTLTEFQRKNSERTDSPYLSPPRRNRKDTGRKNLERIGSSDLSPPLRTHLGSPDKGAPRVSLVGNLSPPRRSKKGSERAELPDLSQGVYSQTIEADASVDLSPSRKSRKDLSPVKAGRRSGLVSREAFKEEVAKVQEDLARFKEIDPSISGKGAEPVYRDKVKGVRISKDEFLKSQKGEEKPKEKKLEWGKGLAQKREAEARQQELELEKDRPFARTRDDPELDKMLKDRVRWGDPMAHLVKRKHHEPVLDDLGDNEKMKESGFMIPQDIPSHSWIKRGIDATPNRYGIKPGRHWDGVDRSNGYEKEHFKRMNEKRATEREAYLWSVSDM